MQAGPGRRQVEEKAPPPVVQGIGKPGRSRQGDRCDGQHRVRRPSHHRGIERGRDERRTDDEYDQLVAEDTEQQENGSDRQAGQRSPLDRAIEAVQGNDGRQHAAEKAAEMLGRELVVVQEPVELAPAPGEQRQGAGQYRREQRRDRGVCRSAGPAPADIEAIPGDREEIEIIQRSEDEKPIFVVRGDEIGGGGEEWIRERSRRADRRSNRRCCLPARSRP